MPLVLAFMLIIVAAKCSPSVLNEMRDVRAAIGETAKFQVEFAGNPKPDIQWSFNNVQLRESNKYHLVVEETTAYLEIINVSYEDVGFYSCKLINEIGMTLTRAKFDISTSTTTETTSHKVTKVKGKKKTTGKKTAAKKIQKTIIVPLPYETSSEEEEVEVQTETTMDVIKVRQPVSILVEKSEVSEVMEVRDRKIADAEVRSQKIIEEEIIEEEEEIEERVIEKRTTIEITKKVEIIRKKISQKIITIEDIIEIKQHEEVQWLLNSIDAESFGSIGESALRDLATIGLLLRHGCTVYEIIYMYEQNIFISLQKPESQSALVQLVEREGHEELITQILSESSSEEETVLAATVGFKAFIRMIQTCEITIETVLRKFVREDFISQDWKIAGKERIVETSQIIESHEAVTHIKIEETFVEERTIIVEEGLNIDSDEM